MFDDGHACAATCRPCGIPSSLVTPGRREEEREKLDGDVEDASNQAAKGRQPVDYAISEVARTASGVTGSRRMYH